MKTRRTKRSAGFTVVELMVVISIIAILATIVGVNLLGAVDEGSVTAAKGQIEKLKTAVISYRLKNKKFPQSLDQLLEPPGFLDAKAVPKDPWGNDYHYTAEGSSKFVITSYGADGSPGGSGFDADITSDNLQGEQ